MEPGWMDTDSFWESLGKKSVTLRENGRQVVSLADVVILKEQIKQLTSERDSLIKTQCDFEQRKHLDGTSDYRCGCDSNMTLLKFFRSELDQARAERDLAIAHDRQPYPTAFAYEQVCKTLERTKSERDKLKAAFIAAKSFIDSHVADPDITDEMVRTYAAYKEALKELE